MTSITMLTHGRPRLTEQALASLNENTDPTSYQAFPMDDEGQLGTGEARNAIIRNARHFLSEHLYLSDNDVYFLPHWLDVLVEAYEWARPALNVVALGAYCHPFNVPYRRIPFHSAVLGRTIEVGLVHALPLQSWLWTWEDWDRFGPFPTTPPGRVCMGEDVEVSARIKAAGGKVAAIYPPLVINCGLTNTRGENIPGRDVVEREPCPQGVIRE